MCCTLAGENKVVLNFKGDKTQGDCIVRGGLTRRNRG